MTDFLHGIIRMLAAIVIEQFDQRGPLMLAGLTHHRRGRPPNISLRYCSITFGHTARLMILVSSSSALQQA
ncbi:hypothetical protein IVA95_21500 [Bradyrhizobium sp. 157]|uniref:hypothetical protein n=1 Tax=Bradyrhizobium sp. 157 TaxID=2782631 RepID=UPI001FF76004|nr:hypothetical protein [Bradyrhizobium sp. 157]MCK1640107.1 hypothetical protein [Bradyrhizobium sp. 157]